MGTEAPVGPTAGQSPVGPDPGRPDVTGQSVGGGTPDGPQPPVDRLVNLRDVGGLRTADGGRTRSGVLYRSEMHRPGDVAPPDSFLWPPATVVDLRSAVERGSSPHPLSALGSEVHVMPLLGEEIGVPGSSVAVSAMAGGLRSLYVAMLDIAAPHLVEILDLAAEAPGPLLVHCAAGKDRTGVVVALLLRLAGVEASEVLGDYAATAANMPSVMRRLKGHVLLPGARENVGSDLAAISMTAAEQVLAELDGHPDGAGGWILERGARPEAVTLWRKRIAG